MLALTYVTLQVRRFFHGPVLSSGGTTDAEQYAYSLAWLAFGVVLLVVGLVFASQRARLASAVVIGLTVLKVFLFDMSNLTGVFRALSFMGLGLVLVVIGWLYQRILFKRQARTAGCGGVRSPRPESDAKQRVSRGPYAGTPGRMVRDARLC